MDEGLQELVARWEAGEKLTPSELGRVGAYRRTQNRKEREERLALAGGADEGEPDPGLENMRKLAATGTGTTAVQAQRYLDERAKADQQRANDQGLLALLSPAQRRCIEAALRGESVSQAHAIEAWCDKGPGIGDILVGM